VTEEGELKTSGPASTAAVTTWRFAQDAALHLVSVDRRNHAELRGVVPGPLRPEVWATWTAVIGYV
jgi:hypothetical protein